MYELPTKKIMLPLCIYIWWTSQYESPGFPTSSQADPGDSDIWSFDRKVPTLLCTFVSVFLLLPYSRGGDIFMLNVTELFLGLNSIVITPWMGSQKAVSIPWGKIGDSHWLVHDNWTDAPSVVRHFLGAIYQKTLF